VNLLRCSRIFTFEPPPGVKASLLRTFGTVPAARMAKVIILINYYPTVSIFLCRSQLKELDYTFCLPGSMP